MIFNNLSISIKFTKFLNFTNLITSFTLIQTKTDFPTIATSNNPNRPSALQSPQARLPRPPP